jgi:hypothetical protein
MVSREGGGAFMSNTNYMKKKNDKRRRDMVVGKVVAHLCLTLFIKELKVSVERDRVVTTLNTIKH